MQTKTATGRPTETSRRVAIQQTRAATATDERRTDPTGSPRAMTAATSSPLPQSHHQSLHHTIALTQTPTGQSAGALPTEAQSTANYSTTRRAAPRRKIRISTSPTTELNRILFIHSTPRPSSTRTCSTTKTRAQLSIPKDTGTSQPTNAQQRDPHRNHPTDKPHQLQIPRLGHRLGECPSITGLTRKDSPSKMGHLL